MCKKWIFYLDFEVAKSPFSKQHARNLFANASKILEITAKSSEKARFLSNWLPEVDFIKHNLKLSNKENHPMLKRSVSSYATSLYERSQENRAIVWKVAKSKHHYQRQFLPGIVSQRGAHTLYPLVLSKRRITLQARISQMRTTPGRRYNCWRKPEST